MQQETQTLETLAEGIGTSDDFERFLKLFVEEFRHNGETWENHDLESFLEGLWGFFLDRAGYYRMNQPDKDPDQPSWSIFADMLLAARVYE